MYLCIVEEADVSSGTLTLPFLGTEMHPHHTCLQFV